jgi:hypothetical protein
MKYTILLLALALTLRAQDAPTEPVAEPIAPIAEPAAPVVDSAPAEPAEPQPLPSITVTTQTVTTVEPLTLSPEQMAGIISAVQAGGISASVPITTANLSSVYLYEQDGKFIVAIKLK